MSRRTFDAPIDEFDVDFPSKAECNGNRARNRKNKARANERIRAERGGRPAFGLTKEREYTRDGDEVAFYEGFTHNKRHSTAKKIAGRKARRAIDRIEDEQLPRNFRKRVSMTDFQVIYEE